MKLFISYAHADIDKIQPILKVFRNARHEVWIDTHLQAGQEWQTQLSNQIEACDVLVYIMTPLSAWSVSEWCHWEFVTAVEHDKPILPILLEKVDLPVVLSRLQFADLTSGFDTGKFSKLLGDLKALYVKNTEDLPPKPSPTEPPPRIKINQTVTASDNAQVNVIGQQNIGKQTNVETQIVGEKQRNWMLPVILGLIIAVISTIFGGLALFPNQVQEYADKLNPTPSQAPFAEDEVGIILFEFDEVEGNSGIRSQIGRAHV